MKPTNSPSPSPTPLTYLILLALADASRHGYGIIKEIGRQGGAESAPTTGALYLALHRMEGEGMIEETSEPPEGSGDARRRYYRLTPKGLQIARAESTRLAALADVAREKALILENPA